MTIEVGDRVPQAKLKTMSADGPRDVQTDELFRGKKTALFAVPGAFTPTCSARHLPGFVEQADALKAKGVDQIVCIAVNDVFVMDAWGKANKAEGKVMMLSDGNGDFAKALGLSVDLSNYGMGLRANRFSMLIDDGVVKQINVEQPGAFEVSSADYLLRQV